MKDGISGPTVPWKAVADLGTNTFQWIIAKPGPGFSRTVGCIRKVGVGIGKGGMEAGYILPEARKRGLEALQLFVEDLKNFGIEPESALVFGTSAFRNARNGPDFGKEIQQQTGLEVRILDGEAEAALIFEGIRACGVLDACSEGLVVDIGGGSVEFLHCLQGKLLWKRSFEIGGLRLLEMAGDEDPPGPKAIERIRIRLETELEPLWMYLQPHLPLDLIGCSGSFETLVDMEQVFLGNPAGQAELQPWHKLEPEAFYRHALAFRTLNLEARLAYPGMLALRAPMMGVAMQLVDLLLKKLQSTRIWVTTWCLKDGALFRE
jgi:exopolyphosphatase/guanosine-5'-triphosphate,3'-diphosphate pyrophosphatase